MKLVEASLESIPESIQAQRENDPRLQAMCMDKSFDFEVVRKLVAEFGATAHIPVRGQQSTPPDKALEYQPRRWVVKRTHSWMNRVRRILIRREKKAENYLALLHFSFALITLRARLSG